MFFQQPIEGVGVQLAQRIVGRVGEIDHDEIEHVRVLFQPSEGIGVDDPHLGRIQRILVQRRQQRMAGEQPGHFRVEIDQCDRFHRVVTQDFAHCQPVAAAQHQHPPRAWHRAQAGMHQRLVVAIFVAGAELQIVVEKQSKIVFPAGHHNALIGRSLGEYDFFGV